MPLQPLYIEPGICKNTSVYSAAKTFAYGEGRVAAGRYVDCNNVRFVAGFPEKRGGWTIQNNTIPYFVIIRELDSWMDLSGNVWLAAASDKFLFAANTSGANTFVDITPQRELASAALTNPLATTAGSSIVTVADTGGVQQAVNDWVKVEAPTAVGGLTFHNWYRVTSINPGVRWTFDAIATAASTATGGGLVLFQYPRNSMTNPFTTVSGSAVVTVAYAAHGAVTGDAVNIANASAVGGVTLSGQYIVTTIDANTFTVMAGSPASSSVSGGGGVVQFTFNITTTPANTGFSGWVLAPYGSLLLACPINGTIYVFDPALGNGVRAHPLQGAPNSVFALFVTPERFVIALGGTSITLNFQSMTIAWPDQNDFTNWTPTITNTANIRALQGGMFFVNGIAIRNGASLAFTERSVFLMNYTGDVFIYQTPKIADNCGLIGPQAVCELGEVAYWMSDSEFWTWNGAVSALPSDDIREYVFNGGINIANRWKSYAVSNKRFKEIEFHYPSANATECDSYVVYHTDQQCWSIGTRDATSGIDSPFPYSTPMFTDHNATVLLLESGYDNVNYLATLPLNSYITTSEVDVTNGTQNVNVFGFLIDTQRQTGNLRLTINSRYYPEDATTATGPYTITPTFPGRVDLRVDGKEVGYKIVSNVLGGDWRLALPRLDLQPAGARR